MMQKVSTLLFCEGEGIETMYWMTPGAALPSVAEWKKTEQSRFDSVRVVSEILPM
jgi:hypothetical protein